MAIEFTQQSLDEDEDDTDDSVIITRVSNTEMKTKKLSKSAPLEMIVPRKLQHLILTSTREFPFKML